MKVFLYFRTYWGKESGQGWLGRNILAKDKYELVEVCIKSLGLNKQDIYSYACIDNSTPEYTEFLKPRFSEVFHTSEGFDVNDHHNKWPVFGGKGGLAKVLNLIENNNHDDDDIVLILEDDYLFVSGGFEEWIDACKHFDGLVSPFDHPDRYIRNDDMYAKRTEIFVHNNRHWRKAEATTSVIGARYKYFRKTSFIRKIPRFHIWFFWPGRLFGKELPSIDRVFYRRAHYLLGIDLFTPIPGIANHLSKSVPPPPKCLKEGAKVSDTQLSPGVNWEKRYREVAGKLN
ncbi:MAG: hypothetical protein J7L96_08905 [Bacteroidales bacterium]|nr:hypothetical protein [Bacteroidales bacterium]